MPIVYEVTLYGCQFKCGHQHVRNRRLMEGHERRCWRNPDLKTCKTCRYEVYYRDSAGDIYGDGRYVEPDWWVRSCHAGQDDLIDAIYATLTRTHPDNTQLYGTQIPPVENCPAWSPDRRMDDGRLVGVPLQEMEVSQ